MGSQFERLADSARRTQAGYLAKRYGASTEEVCLHMIDSDVQPCVVALFTLPGRSTRRQRIHGPRHAVA